MNLKVGKSQSLFCKTALGTLGRSNIFYKMVAVLIELMIFGKFESVICLSQVFGWKGKPEIFLG